jgi:hypothetical protein
VAHGTACDTVPAYHLMVGSPSLPKLSSLIGAGRAVLRPVACGLVPGARGRGQGPEPVRGRVAAALMPEHVEGQSGIEGRPLAETKGQISLFKYFCRKVVRFLAHSAFRLQRLG